MINFATDTLTCDAFCYVFNPQYFLVFCDVSFPQILLALYALVPSSLDRCLCIYCITTTFNSQFRGDSWEQKERFKKRITFLEQEIPNLPEIKAIIKKRKGKKKSGTTNTTEITKKETTSNKPFINRGKMSIQQSLNELSNLYSEFDHQQIIEERIAEAKSRAVERHLTKLVVEQQRKVVACQPQSFDLAEHNSATNSQTPSDSSSTATSTIPSSPQILSQPSSHKTQCTSNFTLHPVQSLAESENGQQRLLQLFTEAVEKIREGEHDLEAWKQYRAAYSQERAMKVLGFIPFSR